MKTPEKFFTSGGPALTATTADQIKANLVEIVTAMDEERVEASDGHATTSPVPALHEE